MIRLSSVLIGGAIVFIIVTTMTTPILATAAVLGYWVGVLTVGVTIQEP